MSAPAGLEVAFKPGGLLAVVFSWTFSPAWDGFSGLVHAGADGVTDLLAPRSIAWPVLRAPLLIEFSARAIGPGWLSCLSW